MNGDGFLSKTEWVLFNNPLKDVNVEQTVIEEALSALDANNDRVLSHEEYMADWFEKVSNLLLYYIPLKYESVTMRTRTMPTLKVAS